MKILHLRWFMVSTRQLPLGADVPRHQVDRRGAGKPDILRDAGRIEDAEVHRRHRPIGGAKHQHIGRRIKAELGEVRDGRARQQQSRDRQA